MTHLQNEIAPKSSNQKTKWRTKSDARHLNNMISRLCCLRFRTTTFLTGFSRKVEAHTNQKCLSQRESAGIATAMLTIGNLGFAFFFAIWASKSHQAREKSTKINFLGPETARWSGGSSTRRGGGRKVRARTRKFVFLGFRREESGMSREFCRDVPDFWGGGVRKVRTKKVRAHFSVPISERIKHVQRAPKGPLNEDPPKSGLRVSVCRFSTRRPMKQVFGRQRRLPKTCVFPLE